jgi:hypothetical protein
MLKKTLDQYRNTNRFWVDVVLTLIIIVLAGLVLKILSDKGYATVKIKTDNNSEMIPEGTN